MTNNQRTHLSRNGVNRRLQQGEVVTTVRGVRQDNPTPPRARAASPQPAPLKNKMRPPPYDADTAVTRPGRPKMKQTRHTTIHLKLRVRADLERKAKEDGLSISATGANILEWFFQQSLYTQNAATLDTAVDKSIGRHMRAYSDRQATLQVRDLIKTEMIVDIVTILLARQPGMNEKTLQEIVSTAHDKARARLTLITPQLKTLIEAVKKLFDTEEVKASG